MILSYLVIENYDVFKKNITENEYNQYFIFINTKIKIIEIYLQL